MKYDGERAIPDTELLEMIQSGNLVVRMAEANGKPRSIEVWKWHGSRKRYVKLRVATYDEDGRLRVNVRVGTNSKTGNHTQRQRTVYLNRLVWLATRREIVPAGFVVDHVDENCTNDWPDNLQLMSEEESDRQGRILQGIRTQDEVPF